MALYIPNSDVSLVVTSILFTTIAVVTVLGRLYIRVIALRVVGLTDYIIASSMVDTAFKYKTTRTKTDSKQVASIAFMITIFFQIKYGLGISGEKLPPRDYKHFHKCLWLTVPFYNLSLVLTKISIVFQYMRIFITPRALLICRIMLGFLVLYGLWTTAGSVVICVPIAAFWNPDIKGHCMDRDAFYFANSALNIATDIIIFAFPMPLLKQLKLPTKQLKVELMFLFGFGTFVCITSMVRLKALYVFSQSTNDTLYEGNVALWSGIEINVAIACSSLPALQPVLTRIIASVRRMKVTRTQRRSIQMVRSMATDPSIQPHQLKALEQMAQLGMKWGDIQVQKEIFQQRNSMPAVANGTEMVEWRADCYSESSGDELKTQNSNECA